ncbi:histidinol dehydrogenase [Segetibacter aerophilus]|uniref:Histidinol dehydrogenase n=1 Tax=Segetibacter aerophilus TaxID=670293 RepID=A0A512B7V4_9BACT|nr:histidinol dehydrogenase [Segetibacter aerophilus]GEO08034.1 histidinol dehydrogenase [Segetibacter aerophilus]
MLVLYEYPEKKAWKKLLLRPVLDNSSLEASVANIVKEVKKSGDEAVRRFTSMFDKVSVSNFKVSAEEISEACDLVDDNLKNAILQAKENIEKFHRAQLKMEERVETMPGVQCWRKSVPIEKVGLYIPGGSAPLFSTILMLGIPAKMVGCKEIILCSPPNKEGKLHPAILYAAHLVGVTQIFKAGGAQGIAALAFGTATIPQVYKIFGPGNQYVTCAKQLVQKDGVAIDMPAGPSEVAVLADDTANAAFVAADLLSQAEHGNDSQAILVTTSAALASETKVEVERQLAVLPRKNIATIAIQNSKIFLVKTIREGIELINEYAPEHLIISCADDEKIGDEIINAGSIFLGNYSPESVGDYASGTNHTLPTNGYAKAYSGVSVDSFVKKITYQKLSKVGLEGIGGTVEIMAEAEGLQAHKNAVSIRLCN